MNYLTKVEENSNYFTVSFHVTTSKNKKTILSIKRIKDQIALHTISTNTADQILNP